MNVSRALLTAMLFVAPYSMVIAEDGQKETPATETAKVEKAGILATAALPFVFVIAQAKNVAGWTADKSFNIPLKYIASFDCLKDGRFAKHVNNNNIGRALVVLAAAGIAYKTYDMYYANADDVDADDNDAIFFEESET